jgi:hypothetical protein
MRSVTLILECCLVLILRNDDWNELTGYPKDHGKDWPNSRMNSLQPREDDVDQKVVRSSFVTANDHTKPANDRTKPANNRTKPASDRRTCTKTSKPSVEATDEERSTA